MKTKILILSLMLVTMCHAWPVGLFCSRYAMPEPQIGWPVPQPVIVQTPDGLITVPLLQKYAAWPVPPTPQPPRKWLVEIMTVVRGKVVSSQNPIPPRRR